MEYVWTIYGVSYKKNQTATLLVINIKYNKEGILQCPP